MSSTRIWPVLLTILIPLTGIAQTPSLVVPVGGDFSIAAFRFDSARRYFTTISTGVPKIKGWDARTERLLFNLEGLYWAEFSTDGKYILALDNQNKCILYHSFTGKKHTEIKSDQWVFKSASLSPSGKYIVTIGTNESARALIWETGTGRLLFDINLGEYHDLNSGFNIYHARFSPDDKTLATSTLKERPIRIWELASGKLLKTLPDTAIVKTELAFTPDGKRLLSWEWSGVSVWDSRTGTKQSFIPERSQLMPYHFFSPNGKYFVIGSRVLDDTAKIWDLETGSLLFRIYRGAPLFSFPQFSHDSRYIATVTPDEKELKLIEIASGRLARVIHDTIHTTDGRVASFEILRYLFAPDNRSILTIGAINCLRSWDITTGDLIFELDSIRGSESRESDFVNVVQFSRGGGFIETSNTQGKIKTYEFKTGKKTRVFSLAKKLPEIISKYAYNPNGKQWLTIIGDKLVVWDRLKGEIQFTLYDDPEYGKGFTSAVFSPDGSTLLTTSFDGSARLWRSSDGRQLLLLPHPRGVTSAAFDPTGRFVLTGCGDSTVRIWDVQEKKFIRALPRQAGIINNTFYSPDGKYVYVESLPPNSTVEVSGVPMRITMHLQASIWRSDSNLLVAKLDSVNTIASQFDPDSKFILFNYIVPSAWDWSTGMVKRIYGTTQQTLQTAFFTPDQKYYVAVYSDTTVFVNYPTNQLSRILPFQYDGAQMIFDYRSNEMMKAAGQRADFYHAESLTPKYSLIGIDSSHHLFLLPDGYYKCRQGTASLLYYVTPNRQFISFEQLDVRYNRPDKVLEAIGNTDTALIRSYRRAWEKRIKKLGIDTTAFRDGYSVPEADFANREAINFEQKSGNLKLHIKGIDSTYKLDRFNVWVNESPIFGQRGISILRKNSNRLDTTITTKLTQGENRIETSITNVNGTESYRMPLYVNYTPAIRQKESLHFIGIGIDKFTDSRHNLQYSSKDIRDLAHKLKEKYKGNITIDTLFNEQVTIENVKKLKQKLRQTTVNDKVILAYSGHGLLSSDFDYYLSTYSINFEKPQEGGLPYEELESLLDSIPARRKLMLIDACHSGEVDKEDLEQLEKVNENGVKGIKPVVYKKEGQLGLQNSFELMQSLFVNVSKGTGATVISAAAGTQFALERGDLKNGVFTFALLEALNKYPTIKISELRKIVSERVEEVTGGAQKPTSRSEPVASDWDF